MKSNDNDQRLLRKIKMRPRLVKFLMFMILIASCYVLPVFVVVGMAKSEGFISYLCWLFIYGSIWYTLACAPPFRWIGEIWKDWDNEQLEAEIEIERRMRWDRLPPEMQEDMERAQEWEQQQQRRKRDSLSSTNQQDLFDP